MNKYFKNVNSVLRQDLDFVERFNEELKKDYPQINTCWYNFLDFLKDNNSFNKVYMEGMVGREVGCQLDQSGSGMSDCINYLSDSGAVFEKTESELLLNLTWKVRRNKLLFNQSNKLREAYLGHRIDSTLEFNDQALLLYGAKHKKGITNLLSYHQIPFEVHENINWPSEYLFN